MASDSGTPPPPREPTPGGSLPSSTAIPLKRPALEEDFTPSVPSPLNPDVRSTPKPPGADEMPAKRNKKESLKKRESKGAFGGDSNRGTPDPKHREPKQSDYSPMRYKLAPPKPSDFEPARGASFTHHHNVPALDGSEIQFYETSEHVHNKKSYHYTHCIADPGFPSALYYRGTEAEPTGPHLSFEDSATHLFFDQKGLHITTNKGFRMTRANVAIREGRFYWETKITRGIVDKTSGDEKPESHGHVRMGFARREATLDAPVGFDAYSYGLRDVGGEKVYMSRPKSFFPEGEGIREGDVIGLEIQLPSERLQRKVLAGQYNPAVDTGLDDDSTNFDAPNIVRDRIPIRFKSHIYFEKIDYHTTKELEDLMNPSPVSSGPANSVEPPNPNHVVPALRTLPGSFIKVYKNGVLMGTPFTDLLAFLPPASKPQGQIGAREGLDNGMLGYYPAVSVFRGGAAEVNFGPDFWFPPPGLEESSDDNEVSMIDAGQEESKKAAPSSSSVPAYPGLDQVRPVSERYTEQIVEDIVYDIIDEVDFWVQDGCKVIDRFGQGGEKAGQTGSLAAGGREEIKELVQDD
ncbi:SPRY domain-containing protein [Colletotrichum scovillei]|uniref:SPRY domain-containing protein n=2 Tax=Colletotrichum acutatum species complex TaxID=2707335 RepID=A0A9P7R375_9PEZI|nr:SPRY domain-containing protein [Colletotrichum scovillei]KXH32249.1 SPRY domain-containing protein [Colletotrichum nymphaeae SA-01]KAF4774315.1 SPRY domain-containing protein [Colletotrichum scovillei]KAG7048677.1 SPRY domain-containing protein [Colletotrichum scovillei]KAG7065840.1 SPRY domain-containing protein [Colletotrichum scovillei]KAG7068442.1 SPRY domain-containing protein [Colletotrichum scovillei]